jgi:hypothetical protein
MIVYSNFGHGSNCVTDRPAMRNLPPTRASLIFESLVGVAGSVCWGIKSSQRQFNCTLNMVLLVDHHVIGCG